MSSVFHEGDGENLIGVHPTGFFDGFHCEFTNDISIRGREIDAKVAHLFTVWLYTDDTICVAPLGGQNFRLQFVDLRRIRPVGKVYGGLFYRSEPILVSLNMVSAALA